jgi:Arm DNA-binding domain
MRGHVRQHGRGWVVVIDTGRENGKRQQRWHSGFRTKKAAEEALTDLLKKLGDGEYVKPTSVTVGEYLTETWLLYLDDQGRGRE